MTGEQSAASPQQSAEEQAAFIPTAEGWPLTAAFIIPHSSLSLLDSCA
jgi:hypothetical protein